MSDNVRRELTKDERKLFEAIEKNDTALVKVLLSECSDANIIDPEYLMTPLQHAAYKGNKEVIQMLLDKGADVNLCEHQHNYTPLHFAALSGNVDVCFALLSAGAKIDVTNTVNRTASQMAAFVGHHKVVAMINNFVPLSEIDHYTKPQGSQEKPYLPPFLTENFHKFIMQGSVHPVKVLLNLQRHISFSHLKEVHKVLELMSEKEMRNGSERNEALSFKFHYLAYIVKEVTKIYDQQGDNNEKQETIELVARKLLKPGKDNNLEYMEAFLRECIREFPHRESTLLRQIVASLTAEDPPSALAIINFAINGERFLDESGVCAACGEEEPDKKCSKCKAVQYCDRNCQKFHWHWHKKSCVQAETEIKKEEKDKNL